MTDRVEKLIDILFRAKAGVSLGAYYSEDDVAAARKHFADRGIYFDEDRKNASAGGWIELTRRQGT